MSVKLMGAVWAVPLPVVTKFVLVVFCDHANDDGECWPSRKRVAEKCGITIKTLDRHISTLVEKGFLLKESRQRENGSSRSNLYHVNPFALHENRGVNQGAYSPKNNPVRPLRQPLNNNGDNPVQPRRQPRNGHGDNPVTAPETTPLEPSLEPSLEPPIEPSIEKNPPFIPPTPEKRKKEKVVKSLPPEQLTPEQVKGINAWVIEKGFPLQPNRTVELIEACLDFHRGAGNQKLDWVATCRTWIRNEVSGKFGRSGPARLDEKPKSFRERVNAEAIRAFVEGDY
jgi:hypothetical protein